MRILILSIYLSLFCFSCRSTKKMNADKSLNSIEKTKEKEVINDDFKQPKSTSKYIIKNTEHYINVFKDIAISEMREYGIPASITLAQGILESGSGKGRLALEANNHFGIKCHQWEGDKIYHDDDKKQECFRKYQNAETSFRDHSEFLAHRSRYSKLFQLKMTDYKNWAKELRKAGYATDKKYPEKLISLIERYELFRFDQLVVGKKASTTKKQMKRIQYKVKKGDTLYSISKTYGVSINEIKRSNNLQNNILKIGQILEIQSR